MRLSKLKIFTLILLFLVLIVIVNAEPHFFDTGVHPVVVETTGTTSTLDYDFKHIKGNDWQIIYCHKDFRQKL